jgi:hypothetical protein
LSRNSTLSTVSTQSTADHLQRRPIGRNWYHFLSTRLYSNFFLLFFCPIIVSKQS